VARIKREDHARILQLVDVERRAVREIAAEFGCTPAAIYALLTKLRRGDGEVAPPPGEAQPPLALGEERAADMALQPSTVQTRTALPEATSVSEREPRVVIFERAAASAQPREEKQRPASAAVGGKLAKPGMGLLMRTPDGEETMTPFRSLDDLLSAIKPMLRAGARSPEPVWFSLQPVDLSTIDVDAA
jgi:transposase-like protein